jgi:hypothetical protein
MLKVTNALTRTCKRLIFGFQTGMERRRSSGLPIAVISMLLEFWSKKERMSMPKVTNVLTTTV